MGASLSFGRVFGLAGGFGVGDCMMGPEMLFVEGQLRGAAGKIEIPTMVMHTENDRVVPVQFSRLVAEELQRRGVQAVAKVYPPPKVGGKEREGASHDADRLGRTLAGAGHQRYPGER